MNEETSPTENPSHEVSVQHGTVASIHVPNASFDDMQTIELLRGGNEVAFITLVNRYHSTMLRLAMVYVMTQAVAEDVVQEAWVGVLQGLSRFEARSSLKTWIFRILTNCAKTRAQREHRSIPFSALSVGDESLDLAEPTVAPDRFQSKEQQWPGHWVSFPARWNDLPEDRLLSKETRKHIEMAIQVLPLNQREVITLRDVEGWAAEETCRFLGISEANQRVLLHRARSKVRGVLEKYFEEE